MCIRDRMMTRLGIDTEPFFEAEDFSVITNFNTPEALNALLPKSLAKHELTHSDYL